MQNIGNSESSSIKFFKSSLYYQFLDDTKQGCITGPYTSSYDRSIIPLNFQKYSAFYVIIHPDSGFE